MVECGRLNLCSGPFDGSCPEDGCFFRRKALLILSRNAAEVLFSRTERVPRSLGALLREPERDAF